MVEQILEVASEILHFEIEGEALAPVKVAISQLWMLTFIEFSESEKQEFFELCDALKNEILDIKFKLESQSDQNISDHIKRTEHLFYKLFIYKLNIDHSQFDDFLRQSEPMKVRCFLSLLEKVFNMHLSAHNDFLSIFNFFEFTLNLLDIFGFKRSVYVEVTVLKFINALIPFSVFQNAVNVTNSGDFVNIDKLVNDDRDIVVEGINSNNILQIIFQEVAKSKIDIPPLAVFKDIIREAQVEITNSQSIVDDIVNHFFSSVDRFFTEHKLNSLILKFESDFSEELSTSSLCHQILELQFLRPRTCEPNPCYDQGRVYTIVQYGFTESSRSNYDRIVKFGKFSDDCSENDLYLHNKFSNFNTLIVCSCSGYYICDCSNEGFFFRNVPNGENVLIEVGTVFQLGPEMILSVANIDRETNANEAIVKVRVHQGGGLAGAYLYCTLSRNKPKINVGRDQNPSGLVILDCTNKVSSNHCFMVFENDKIFLQPIDGKKIYINLKKLDQTLSRMPSDFYHLAKEENFLIKEVVFKFVPKNLDN